MIYRQSLWNNTHFVTFWIQSELEPPAKTGFFEDQLSPSSIGISPLSLPPPSLLPQTPVRTDQDIEIFWSSWKGIAHRVSGMPTLSAFFLRITLNSFSPRSSKLTEDQEERMHNSSAHDAKGTPFSTRKKPWHGDFTSFSIRLHLTLFHPIPHGTCSLSIKLGLPGPERWYSLSYDVPLHQSTKVWPRKERFFSTGLLPSLVPYPKGFQKTSFFLVRSCSPRRTKPRLITETCY